MTKDQMIQPAREWTCPECKETRDVYTDFREPNNQNQMRPCPECGTDLCNLCPQGACEICSMAACSNCGQQIGDLWICADCKPIVNRILCAWDNAKAQAEREKALQVADAMKQIVLAGCQPMASRKAFAELGAVLCQR